MQPCHERSDSDESALRNLGQGVAQTGVLRKRNKPEAHRVIIPGTSEARREEPDNACSLQVTGPRSTRAPEFRPSSSHLG